MPSGQYEPGGQMVQAVITSLPLMSVMVAKKPSSQAQVAVLRLAMPFTASGQVSVQSDSPSPSVSVKLPLTTHRAL
jgi:hypothetical protein